MSRPKCPTPCRRASTATTAGAAAPGAQPSTRGSRAIAPPMPPLAPVRRTRQRWSCINRWYPCRGSGRPAALGRLRVLAFVPSSTEPSWRRSDRPGDFFGELAILGHGIPRTATVIAKSNIRGLVFNSHFVYQIQERVPLVGERIEREARERRERDTPAAGSSGQ
jgi:hypothetical protein